jgi:hypothetical protein
MRSPDVMKKIIISLFVLFVGVITPIMLPGNAYAACKDTVANSSEDQVLEGVQRTGVKCSDSGVVDIINTAVTILSVVAGIAGVIMVIVAGFKYITSGGDTGKVGSAKSTLVYALIGLAIAVLAQVLVHFVISTANSTVTACSTNKNIPASDPGCTKPKRKG